MIPFWEAKNKEIKEAKADSGEEGKIDFNKMEIKVSRHKMVLTDVDNSNGVDVVISFGDSTCVDHFKMKEKDDHDNNHNDNHDNHHKKNLSHKEKDD